ncbi:hypothetical protein GCM10007320_03640 [Pseudorhodoferax aquiterrae]|uniref:Uncharacterized protein n=1 Tax=Pseudorhodoferax aquiterrae TaxID=747304 RepID=A0ABQ3FV51_9BURK|nr:hypothetical protein [Pseudorhodoferax aquiterrae]GHC69824.1 hypothetical protein GCM10007320_03640 [Pseudorhodoferax aquiterrae]
MDARPPRRQRARLHTIGLGMAWCCCASLPASALVRTATPPSPAPAPAGHAITAAADTRAAERPPGRPAPVQDRAPRPRAATPAEPEPAAGWLLAGALATLLSLRRHVRAPGLLEAAARPDGYAPAVRMSRR